MLETPRNLEDKGNLSNLKDVFSLRTGPSIFLSIALGLLGWSNKTSSVLPELKSACYFLPQSTVSYGSDWISETNSTQPANVGHQDVPRTSPSNVSRAFHKGPIWPSWGRPNLTSWGRPEMAFRGRSWEVDSECPQDVL